MHTATHHSNRMSTLLSTSTHKPKQDHQQLVRDLESSLFNSSLLQQGDHPHQSHHQSASGGSFGTYRWGSDRGEYQIIKRQKIFLDELKFLSSVGLFGILFTESLGDHWRPFTEYRSLGTIELYRSLGHSVSRARVGRHESKVAQTLSCSSYRGVSGEKESPPNLDDTGCAL